MTNLFKSLLVVAVALLGNLGLDLETPALAFNPNNITLVQDVYVKPTEPACLKIDEGIPAKIDMKKVRQSWLDWNNGIREAAKLDLYEMEPVLSLTAEKWSNRALGLGSITHKRDGQKTYYDYKKILSWFKDNGVEFANYKGYTMTENIGWGYYKCPADNADCTDNIIKAVRTTFDFFASEKKKNGVHWRSMMNSQYKKIGLGLALDGKNKKYYLTIHYGTELTATPGNVCD